MRPNGTVPATPGASIDSIAVSRVTDNGLERLAVVRPDGTVSLYATQGSNGEHGFLFDGAFATGVPTPIVLVQNRDYNQLFGNNLLVITGTGELRRYTAAGAYTVVGSGFNDAGGAALDGNGGLLVSSRTDGKVYRLSCLSASIASTNDASGEICPPSNVWCTVTATAAADAPVTYRWQLQRGFEGHEYDDLVEGGPVTIDGAAVATVTGTDGPTLHVAYGPYLNNDAVPNNWRATFRCVVSTPCGSYDQLTARTGILSADVGRQGGVYGHDGQYNNNDFVAFIDLFFSQDSRADVGASGGLQLRDGRLNNNDFVSFIDMFFTHC